MCVNIGQLAMQIFRKFSNILKTKLTFYSQNLVKFYYPIKTSPTFALEIPQHLFSLILLQTESTLSEVHKCICYQKLLMELFSRMILQNECQAFLG